MSLYDFRLNKQKMQVEGRIKAGSQKCTTVLVVVGLDGYDHNYYKRVPRYAHSSSTLGKNVHISMNGPLQLTFSEAEAFVANLNQMITEAKEALENV